MSLHSPPLASLVTHNFGPYSPDHLLGSSFGPFRTRRKSIDLFRDANGEWTEMLPILQ